MTQTTQAAPPVPATATGPATGTATGPATGTAADPTIRQRWRRHRVIVGVIALGVVAAFATALLSAPARQGDLDPRSYAATGTHALTALLGDRGVHVDTVTTADAAKAQAVRGSTLVVVNPDRIDDGQLSGLAQTPADLVVIGAGPLELGSLGLDVRPGGGTFGDQVVGPSGDQVVDPACALPAAAAAGSVLAGPLAYQVPDGGTGCYPVADGFALVTFARDGRKVTLLGDGAPFTNAHLATDGDAALGLGVLDANPHVVWLAPALIGPSSDADPHATLTSLLPSRLKWALLQLAIAVGVLALWRGRRLGRLVPEALPVVVRQAETVVGRARLYRRSRSLDRAAAALRAGSRDRLARRLGFGAGVSDDALVDAISRRLQGFAGRGAPQVGALLYGPTPSDDTALVALAHDLAALEQEVFHT
jgi:hypothetical protein